MADITLQSIAHSYAADPPEYVLHDVELRWRSGGAYALLGPSGCGKTTLLNIISGLIRPTNGRVRYGDRDVTELSTRERNIAQVFQFPVIYDTMTVYDNLAFPLRNRRVSAREIAKRVEHIADLLELSDVLRDKATRLTPDLKQIISLGRGLVRDDVAAILFDEPLTVIDPHRKWVLRRKLREIHRQFEHTLIYVTHDQTEALTFADEVVVMHEGRVLQQGTPEQLFTRPAHAHVGYFIGSPGMNFLPVAATNGDGGGDAMCTVAGFPLALPAEVVAKAAALDGALELGIRPEHLVIVPAANDDDDSDVAPDGLPLAIAHVEDHGRFHVVAGTIGACPVKVKARVEALGAAAAVGQTARVRVPAEHACLYHDKRLVE